MGLNIGAVVISTCICDLSLVIIDVHMHINRMSDTRFKIYNLGKAKAKSSKFSQPTIVFNKL